MLTLWKGPGVPAVPVGSTAPRAGARGAPPRGGAARRSAVWLRCLLLVLLLLPLRAWGQATNLVNANEVIVGHVNMCTTGPTSTAGNAYACTFDRAITQYVNKACYGFVADVANTGPASLNLHSLGAKPITRAQGSITTALAAGDIVGGQLVRVCYDGTQMQCQNCDGNVATGSGPSYCALPYCEPAGSTDDYACALFDPVSAYGIGTHYTFKANVANSGAATINFSGLGAKTIKKYAGGASTDLATNDLVVGQIVEVVYDGTAMQMTSQPGTCLTGIQIVEKVLTNNTAVTIATAGLGNGSVHASQYHYVVEVTNGTDYQVEDGSYTCHATNKAGTIANNTCIKFGNQQAATAGTLTVTFALSAANPALVSVNANSSLTPSAGFPRLRYQVRNLTSQALTTQ